MAIPLARITLAGSGFLIAGGVMLAAVALRQRDEPTQSVLVASASTKTADAIASTASWSSVPDPRLAPTAKLVEPPKVEEEPAPIEAAPMIVTPCPPPAAPTSVAPTPAPATPAPPTSVAPKPKADGVGWVRVKMPCWGWASSEGSRVETLGGKLALAPGKHAVTITMGAECASKDTVVRTVDVKPSTTTQISVNTDDD